MKGFAPFVLRLEKLLLQSSVLYIKMKFHTRTILYRGTIWFFYIDNLISISEKFFQE